MCSYTWPDLRVKQDRKPRSLEGAKNVADLKCALQALSKEFPGFWKKTCIYVYVYSMYMHTYISICKYIDTHVIRISIYRYTSNAIYIEIYCIYISPGIPNTIAQTSLARIRMMLEGPLHRC